MWKADGRATVSAPAARLQGGTQPTQRAVEGEVGTLQVHVRPDQLDELVLGGAALAAVEEEGEDRLRLARAGLLAAPAPHRLAVALDAQRTEREDVQARS